MTALPLDTPMTSAIVRILVAYAVELEAVRRRQSTDGAAANTADDERAGEPAEERER